MHKQYGGLRLAVLYPDQGVVDSIHLAFADHATFTRRDAARGIGPGGDGYARFRDWHNDNTPPWRGEDASGLRRATVHWARIWFPETRVKPGAVRTAPANNANQVKAAAGTRTSPHSR